MTSKRDIRVLKRENFKLKVENSTLIKKNRVLETDNSYFVKFLNLILDIADDSNHVGNFKLFH